MVDEPDGVRYPTDDFSFLVVHIFSFAFVQGKMPGLFSVTDRKVADGEGSGFQNMVAHAEKKLRSERPSTQSDIFNGSLIISYFDYGAVAGNIHFE